ncbi:MAG TPA: molybdate ABC transporter substrate-binding protein [Candidatus Nanopelagicales bacterium]|nr:molybdate ABC transporter substrate-binding protein [Candidatus Nanopelagicales bacterium]
MRRIRPALSAVVAATALTLAACGSSSGSSTSTSSSPSSSSSVTGSITVFAASSLKESFTAIGKAFEAANPGTSVTFDFGASSTLATQITQGAPADVFASASTKTMTTVTDAGDAGDPTTFAVNTMEIATPNPQKVPVAALADLASASVKTVVCQKDVPCGAAAATLFAQNKLTVAPVSEEVDVKSVLAKVELGEADAGIVYVTDVKAAGDKVVGVQIPNDQNVTTTYPIATIKASTNPVTAAAFMAYVLSVEGQKVLADAGFAAP